METENGRNVQVQAHTYHHVNKNSDRDRKKLVSQALLVYISLLRRLLSSRVKDLIPLEATRILRSSKLLNFGQLSRLIVAS